MSDTGPPSRLTSFVVTPAEKLTRDQAAMAVRERTGRGDFPGKVRAEIRPEGGRKVIVTGLTDDRPETILAALRQVTKAVQG